MKRRIWNSLAGKVLVVIFLSYMITCFLLKISLYWYMVEIYHTPGFYESEYFFLIPFIGSIAVFVLVFLIFVNRRLKYFRYIIRSVKEIDSMEFLNTLEEKGNDEFTELAQSINVMNGRIQEKFLKEKEIEESKNELITLISHDLKTPLTSIIGYLELINGELNEEERKKYAKVAYNKSLRLKTLVNELFEYTKLSATDINVEKVSFNLSNLINQVVGESILDFSEKHIEVVLDNPYKELYSEVDVKLITRLLENMVGNAKKYSDEDSIFHVTVKEEARDIVLLFENKCEHLNEGEVERIFEKFYREDQARSSENEGTGLGLTIAKRIVELHGGRIFAEKKKDHIIFKVCLKKQRKAGC